jgi:hypothetical protein
MGIFDMYKDILASKRSAILEKWQLRFAGTYPQETVTFLLHEKDRFANPVAAAFTECFDSLYDELIGEMDPQRIRLALDYLVKIRSVQGYSPSESLNFVFLLKHAICDELQKENPSTGLVDGFVEVTKRIDEIALTAFDLYMKSREKIYELKSDEIKRRSFRVLKQLSAESDAFG